MGIWDNVKSRLGFGGGYAGYNDYDNGEYADGAYDEYGDGDYDEYDATAGYSAPAGTPAEGVGHGDRAVSMRNYGVDRADYYNDNHAPLVTHSDVRAQQLPLTPTVGQPQDRIPAPRAYRRSSTDLARSVYNDDAFAFKNGLARTPGSFAQLQSERLRMEDTGRLTVVSGAAAPAATVASAPVAPAAPVSLGTAAAGQARLGTVVDGNARFAQAQAQAQTQAQVRSRVHRRIEHIRPMSYADAEQVAQELKRGIVVVLDLRSARPELAKRILDFSFGVASALDGQVDRHIDRVYVFTRNGSLTDEERAAIRV
ncbi:MAG: cell division protein SepF [Coriobacteriales bacterium]|jgi:cell division inhibitor SepF|nr:cell division protein SepF [Coriobacteriales bacterium]